MLYNEFEVISGLLCRASREVDFESIFDNDSGRRIPSDVVPRAVAVIERCLSGRFLQNFQASDGRFPRIIVRHGILDLAD